MTLRQALQLLADDGLIDTRHGSGTYVASRYAYGLGHLRSFAADLDRPGSADHHPAARREHRRGAGRRRRPPRLPRDVFRLRRLRLADGRPFIVQTSYLPAQLAAAIDPADLCRRGLSATLAEHGRAVGRASETISPAALGARDARDLGRPVASPALLSHQVSFTNGRPPCRRRPRAAGRGQRGHHREPLADRLDVHYTLATR